MQLVMVGPPGAGKGTQAKLLSSELGVPHISTGEMLRSAVASGSELGNKVKSIIESGSLVDDATILEVVKSRLAKPDCEKGFILDGYPRNTAQAGELSALLSELGKPLSKCLYFELSDEIALERMSGRAEKEGRADDTREVQEKRLEVYKSETEPLLNYYKNSGQLSTVDAGADVETVRKRALEAIGVG